MTIVSLFTYCMCRYKNEFNCLLNDKESEEAVLDSVLKFKEAGGGCLVENSTIGLQRRSTFLKELSERTGVHVIAGTGYYVDPFLNVLNIKTGTTEDMAKHMISELTIGCVDDASVKCGFIGEIGISNPLTGIIHRTMDQNSKSL